VSDDRRRRRNHAAELAGASVVGLTLAALALDHIGLARVGDALTRLRPWSVALSLALMSVSVS
jgi:hypothetical protein